MNRSRWALLALIACNIWIFYNYYFDLDCWPWSNPFYNYISKASFLLSNLREGLVPLWLPYIFNGQPFLLHDPPIFYFLTAGITLLTGFPLISLLKVVLIVSYNLNALLVFLIVKELFSDERRAVLAAFVFSTSWVLVSNFLAYNLYMINCLSLSFALLCFLYFFKWRSSGFNSKLFFTLTTLFLSLSLLSHYYNGVALIISLLLFSFFDKCLNKSFLLLFVGGLIACFNLFPSVFYLGYTGGRSSFGFRQLSVSYQELPLLFLFFTALFFNRSRDHSLIFTSIVLFILTFSPFYLPGFNRVYFMFVFFASIIISSLFYRLRSVKLVWSLLFIVGLASLYAYYYGLLPRLYLFDFREAFFLIPLFLLFKINKSFSFKDLFLLSLFVLLVFFAFTVNNYVTPCFTDPPNYLLAVRGAGQRFISNIEEVDALPFLALDEVANSMFFQYDFHDTNRLIDQLADGRVDFFYDKLVSTNTRYILLDMNSDSARKAYGFLVDDDRFNFVLKGRNGNFDRDFCLFSVNGDYSEVSDGVLTGFSIKPHLIALNVSVASSTNLTIKRTYFPGWTALVNGLSVPITSTSDQFISVPVRLGDNVILLEFKPEWPYAVGAWLSIIGLVMFLVFLFI